MSTKIAIVTGAAGNLGRAVVTKFIDNNFKVIAAVRNKNMTTTARANFEEVALDLTDEESCQEFIDKTIA